MNIASKEWENDRLPLRRESKMKKAELLPLKVYLYTLSCLALKEIITKTD